MISFSTKKNFLMAVGAKNCKILEASSARAQGRKTAENIANIKLINNSEGKVVL